MMLRRSPLLLTALIFGYAFLYGPIISLMVYSFNKSRLVTVLLGKAGFSTKEYLEPLQRYPWNSLILGGRYA
ncbi:hypothetical protein [Marinobacterium aestuariivivens]|uniref:ABC transporter permease n=1 Tax=Marinobacterium aestuariivivens TaxID=1698799 RepID=A0ABW1ZVW9_9GAMM